MELFWVVKPFRTQIINLIMIGIMCVKKPKTDKIMIIIIIIIIIIRHNYDWIIIVMEYYE